VGKQQNNKD